jgi:PAS domain S-box-containing protein
MFRIIFEKSTDAIFVLNSNTGQYLDANQSAEKITGRTIEEIRKLTTFDITPENASERLAAANKSRQAIEYGEIVYIQPDGRERTAILRAVTIDNELVYGFATDITERKEAENHLSNMIRSLEQRVAQSKAGLDRSEGELNELLEKLNSIQEEVIRSERLKAVGTMVAGVAHEINTPIGIAVTGVSYIAEVLQENGQGKIHDNPAPQELVQTVRIVLDNLRRASDLIRRFKMVAVEQIDEQTSDICMRQLLSDLIFSYIHKLKKSKAVINLDCGEEIHFKGSAGDLLQIFSNLIENSIIHGRPDEENADVLHIEIAVREQNSRIEIRYTDDGRGIHESIRGRIFEPFFTTRRSEGGTGLGLHIVYKIVEDRLLGTIELLDLPVGTGFSVSFPAAFG